MNRNLQDEEFPSKRVRRAFLILGLILIPLGAYYIISGPGTLEIPTEIERGTFQTLPPDVNYDLRTAESPFVGFESPSNVVVVTRGDTRTVYDLDSLTYTVYSINTRPDYGSQYSGALVAAMGAVTSGLGLFLRPIPPRTTTMIVEGREVRVRIVWDSCMGAGSCVNIAPKVFRLDIQKIKSVFVSRVPLELLDEKGADPETVFLAAQSCPYKAIILEDANTGERIFP